MPYCNSDVFEQYLNLFSQHHPQEFKIMVLDNGAFHKARKLKIPPNIALLFLPPYSPELNPAERIWQYFKRRYTNVLFQNLHQLSEFFTKTSHFLDEKTIISTCAYEYISLSQFWSI